MQKNNNPKQLRNQRGQLSIFVGVSIIIIMTVLAFIVNVGLFVKAKINLQNAVDAAAWSGAAVQARQLSNIGYLNWEMRNTYKEWMFKYYVLGVVALDKVQRSNLPGNDNANMDFRLKPFFDPGEIGFDPNTYDPYNIPSICVHLNDRSNICKIVSIPGLPRFNTVGLPSITEHHNAFLDSIVKTKANDCSVRSDLNFGTAMLWAYGTKARQFSDIPLIAGDRVGAWPQAIELGMRMRNLEMIMNRPPVDSPICYQGGGCTPVSSLDNEQGGLPLNERPIKAFWSAFRNLSGGTIKDDLSDEFARTFKLTEIAPTPYEAPENSLSAFLIPPNVEVGQSGITANVKHYVDLQAFPLNLATFFTTFVSSSEEFGQTGLESQAACSGTKTALPVPGYLFGFVKNPEVITYYAVKGEADFVGLFFPFSETRGITLKAYAAAKPFGGRVGPRLFGLESTTVEPRNDSRQFRSAPYVSGIETVPGSFKPGDLIPQDPNFWIKTNQNLGGVPGSGAQVYFGLPNLLYDYNNISELSGQESLGSIQIVTKANSLAQSQSPLERFGLYKVGQYRKFVNNLVNIPLGGTMSQADLHRSIEQVRRPTRYEALNYLIPTFQPNASNNPESLEAVSVVQDEGNSLGGSQAYSLFAPLFGPNTLYGENLNSIIGVVEDYIGQNQKAIDTFLEALKEVADSIRSSGASSQSGQIDYNGAADSIHKAPLDISGGTGCNALSMAQKFHQFFRGAGTACGITPLPTQMREYFFREQGQSPNANKPYRTFFRSSYVPPISGVSNQLLHSGYMPGPRQGADDDGAIRTIFPQASGQSAPYFAKRNYYSTKFVAVDKLTSSAAASFTQPSSYMESATMEAPSDLQNVNFANPIQESQLSEFESFDH